MKTARSWFERIIWNKGILLEQQRGFIILNIYGKRNECFLPTSYYVYIIRPAMCLVKVLYGAQLVKTKVMYNCSVMKKCKRWFHNGLVFFVTFEQSPILIFRRRRRVIRLSAYYMTWLGVVPWIERNSLIRRLLAMQHCFIFTFRCEFDVAFINVK